MSTNTKSGLIIFSVLAVSVAVAVKAGLAYGDWLIAEKKRRGVI